MNINRNLINKEIIILKYIRKLKISDPYYIIIRNKLLTYINLELLSQLSKCLFVYISSEMWLYNYENHLSGFY